MEQIGRLLAAPPLSGQHRSLSARNSSTGRDGTAVDAESIEMPAVLGFAVAPGANQIVPPVDWVDPPVRIDNVYGTLVCAVDADGNEVAGLRSPRHGAARHPYRVECLPGAAR